MRYIALLRGINVSGKNMIKMAELKVTFQSLGFTDVATYINSGNIGFDSDTSDETALIKKIENAIDKDFGFTPQTMLRQRDLIEPLIKANPFAGKFESHKEMHLLFMKDEMPPDKQALLLAAQTDDEQFRIVGREIYCHLRLGVADSVLGKGLIEKKLKTPVTGRNWRTVERLTTL